MTTSVHNSFVKNMLVGHVISLLYEYTHNIEQYCCQNTARSVFDSVELNISYFAEGETMHAVDATISIILLWMSQSRANSSLNLYGKTTFCVQYSGLIEDA